MKTMTKRHLRWKEFAALLDKAIMANGCKGGRDKTQASIVLAEMGGFDIFASFVYFDQHHGYCDCGILYNVDIYADAH